MTATQTASQTESKTVREIALEQPSSIRIFEHFGIDYCCGGRQPLAAEAYRSETAPHQEVAGCGNRAVL